MNKEAIANEFEKLVTTTPEQFDSNLATVVQAFLDANSMYEIGESDCFNPILLSGCFTLAIPPLFDGELKEAHRVRCTAAVLYEISLKAKNDFKPLGWSALNLDAKGFCRNLLKCELPSTISGAAVRELSTAKSLVGRLVDDAELLPMDGREPLQRVEPSRMLDKQIDE